MKRVLPLLTVVALTPLIMGGGGPSPGPQIGTKITGPAISAVIVMDPHQDGVTTTAKQATIWLQKGSQSTGAAFHIPSTFTLSRGCDLSLTAARFINSPGHDVKLVDWIPQAIINNLFAQLGVPISPGSFPTSPPANLGVPVITDVNNAVCTPDPFNSSAPGPGFLSLQAVVQLEINN